jgi:hypothetical protein
MTAPRGAADLGYARHERQVEQTGDLADEQPFLPVQAQALSIPREERLLVSNTAPDWEINGMAQSYQNAAGGGNPFQDQPAPYQHKPLYSYSVDQPQTKGLANAPGTVLSLGLGIGGVPLRNSSRYSSSTVSSPGSSRSASMSNSRTSHQDPYHNFEVEPYNNFPLSSEETEPFRPRSETWVPQRLNTHRDPNHGEDTLLTNSRENVNNNGNEGAKDRSPSIDIPPKSPLRKNAGRNGDMARERETGGKEVRRYQLVDQVLDDVPILSSPGRLRMGRGERRS